MKRILCVLLAAALLACCTACGKEPPSSQQAGTSTPPAPSLSTIPDEPDSQSESEPEPPPYDPAVLTGLPKEDDYPEGQRVTAIMVNNMANTSFQNARPQSGLSQADVLIEIKVEGGITRFCALFTDYRDLSMICPVRSARDQFFQLILPLQAIYVHAGESSVQKNQFKPVYSYESLDVDLDVVGFKRDSSRTGVAIEHTAYVDGPGIQAAIDKLGTDTERTYTSPLFNFVPYDEPARVLTGDDAQGIAVVHSRSYRTYFDWDAEKNQYMMSQYALKDRAISPTIDRDTGEQLGFENVLVLFTDFDVYPDPGGSGYDLQKVNFAAGSVGYYFSGGKSEYIRWKKSSPMEALYLLDGNGNETPIQINTGKTYLAIVDLDEAGEFFYNTDGTAQNGQVERVGDDDSTASFVEADN